MPEGSNQDTASPSDQSSTKSTLATSRRSASPAPGGRVAGTREGRTVIRATSSADDPGRDGVRLGVTTFTTAASFVGLVALGAIGTTIGGDTWLGVGPMNHSIGEFLVAGVRMPLVLLEALYASGVADPLFFAAAMGLLIPPIAALAAARPGRSGGPRPSSAALAAGRVAATLIIAVDIGIGVRLWGRVAPTFPESGVDPGWIDGLRSMAAADGVAMVFAILVAVLVFRLPVDRWVRRLAGTIAITTAVAASVSAAAGTGVVAAVEAPRPIVVAVGESLGAEAGRILIGTTADGRTLVLPTAAPRIRVLDAATPHVVIGTTTIADALDDAD